MGKKKPAAKRRGPTFREWRLEGRLERRRRRALKRVAAAQKMGAVTAAEADELRDEISIGDFLTLWEIMMDIIEWVQEWLRNR